MLSGQTSQWVLLRTHSSGYTVWESGNKFTRCSVTSNYVKSKYLDYFYCQLMRRTISVSKSFCTHGPQDKFIMYLPTTIGAKCKKYLCRLKIELYLCYVLLIISYITVMHCTFKVFKVLGRYDLFLSTKNTSYQWLTWFCMSLYKLSIYGLKSVKSILIKASMLVSLFRCLFSMRLRVEKEF